MMDEMLRFRESGKLNSTQTQWFTDKSRAELYDSVNDPHNLVNLAGNKEYAEVEKELRQALLYHRDEYIDYGMMPEAQLINQMWPNFEQPVTAPVEVIYEPETGSKNQFSKCNQRCIYSIYTSRYAAGKSGLT
jgi:hypothetical protein